MEDATAANNELTRTRLNVKHQKATVNLCEPRGGDDVRADRQSLQVVYLDAGSNTKRAGRKRPGNGLRAGGFHHPDHRGGRKDGGKVRLEVGPGPFRADIGLVTSFQTGNQDTGL